MTLAMRSSALLAVFPATVLAQSIGITDLGSPPGPRGRPQVNSPPMAASSPVSSCFPRAEAKLGGGTASLMLNVTTEGQDPAWWLSACYRVAF